MVRYTAEQISESLLKGMMPLIREEEDIVVIHSALMELGFHRSSGFSDGIKMCLQALLDKGKTIAIPSFTFSFTKDKKFDIENSPYETGSLAKLARTELGFKRTRNPMFSYCIKGPKSNELFNTRSDSGYGEGTIIESMTNSNTCIIMLGCSWAYCTPIHNIEERRTVPYREYINWNYPVDFDSGVINNLVFELFVRKNSPSTNTRFERIRDELISNGMLRSSIINNKVIESANGEEIAKLAEYRLMQNPYFFVDINK